MGESEAMHVEGMSKALYELREHYSHAPDLPWMLASSVILEANRRLTVRLEEVLSEFGLNARRAEVLVLVSRAPAHTASAMSLKHRTFLHPPTMTYTLDWLEDHGLVKRVPHKSDRRAIAVRLTPKGARVVAEVSDALSEIRYGLDGVDEGQAEAIVAALSRAMTDDMGDGTRPQFG